MVVRDSIFPSARAAKCESIRVVGITYTWKSGQLSLSPLKKIAS